MVIEDMIKKNELDRIEEVVNNLEIVGCKENFKNYVLECRDNRSKLSPVEKLFFEELERLLQQMAYESLTRGFTTQDYIEGMEDAYYNGFYALNERDTDDLLDTITYDTSDRDCYELIVDYMTKAIERVREKGDLDKTKEKEKHIVNVEKTLQEAIGRVEQLKNELEQLKNI